MSREGYRAVKPQPLLQLCQELLILAPCARTRNAEPQLPASSDEAEHLPLSASRTLPAAKFELRDQPSRSALAADFVFSKRCNTIGIGQATCRNVAQQKYSPCRSGKRILKLPQSGTDSCLMMQTIFHASSSAVISRSPISHLGECF